MDMCKEFHVGETVRIGDTEYIVAHIDYSDVMYLITKYCEWCISSFTDITVYDYCTRWEEEKIPNYVLPLCASSDWSGSKHVFLPDNYDICNAAKGGWQYFKNNREAYWFRDEDGKVHSFLVDEMYIPNDYSISDLHTEDYIDEIYKKEEIDDKVGFRPCIRINISEPKNLSHDDENARWDLLNQLAKDKAL